MPKRTPKQLAYVEPPPSPHSSGPGKGVWSDFSDLKVIDRSRDTLRQAIHDALLRLPPVVAETASLRTLPGDMQLNAFAAIVLGLETPWQTADAWKRRRLASRWRVSSPEEPSTPRPVVVGTAEIHAQTCWRFIPGYQSREDVRAGILDEIARALDRELDAAYDHVRSIRARPSTRRNLDRDAMRLVFRICVGLSDDQIRDYESGYEVPLEGGHTLTCSDRGFDDDDDRPLDAEEARTARDTIDQSIRNLARDAEISLPLRRLGRPPDPPPLDDPNKEYLA